MTFLANIGSSTATIFKFIYLKINVIKRKFRFKKIKSDYLRTEQLENQYFENHSSCDKSSSNHNLKEDLNDARKSDGKLSFKSKNNEQKQQQNESIITNGGEKLTMMDINNGLKLKGSRSSLRIDRQDSKKSILDVKFTDVNKNNNKLIEASKRIDNLIVSELDSKFVSAISEINLNNSDDSDRDIDDSKVNKSLIPKIFKYFNKKI